MRLKLHGYSTALFSTWIMVEEYGVLFDAGDGVSSALLQKCRKAKTIAVSHADRDHVTGILQLNQLNARHGIESLVYPADSGSFPALKDFCAKFDPESADAYPWIPARPGDRVPIGQGLSLETIANTHIESDQVKSVGYRVVRHKQKLRQEYLGLPGKEIERLTSELGREALVTTVEDVELAYAGDTGVEDADKWRGVGVLIHESTFIDRCDADSTRARNLHSVLEDVLAMAAATVPGALVLHHFSTRYSSERIQAEIKRIGTDMAISFPVYAILPGETSFDILASPPVHG